MNAALAFPDFPGGSVWLVGAGPGDPGLLTLHAANALAHADVVLHDALVAPEILQLVRPAARVERVGKRASAGGAAQLRINQRLIVLARRGLRVVRLKGGDPCVFGRGGEEALALVAAGIPFRIVPGITAGIGAAAAAGIPVTHRSVAPAVTFVTGHNAGGGPPRNVDWDALARGGATLVLYMARRFLAEIAPRLIAAGRDPGEPVAVVSDATAAAQRVRRTTLAEAGGALAAVEPGAPTIVVIGRVAALGDLLGRFQDVRPAEVTTRVEHSSAGLQ